MMRFFFTLVVLLFAVPAFAQEDVMSIDLAEDHVDITTGFNGAHLVLFGVKDKPGDIAVVIRGPLVDTVVRRKERVSGMWLNRASMKFEDVPVYYDYALSRDEKTLQARGDLKALGIGLDGLHFAPEDDDEKQDKIQNFQEALVRNKQSLGLYPLKPKAIKFIKSNFFKTTFYLPANVPVGTYEIDSFLIDKGNVVEHNTTSLRVGQVGNGAAIYKFAHEHGLLYGLICVLIAVIAGWAVNLLRQRD